MLGNVTYGKRLTLAAAVKFVKDSNSAATGTTLHSTQY